MPRKIPRPPAQKTFGFLARFALIFSTTGDFFTCVS
jgi:hypothetical protein